MDFEAETRKHIQEVGKLLHLIAIALLERANGHDASKLESPEREVFSIHAPKFEGIPYESKEYTEHLKQLEEALDHHYHVNRHHPEHFSVGIAGMNLVDLVEMFCDWLAATKRHGGDARRSVLHNQSRFDIPVQLTRIFLNTLEMVEKETKDGTSERKDLSNVGAVC